MLTAGRPDGQKNMFFLYYIDVAILGDKLRNRIYSFIATTFETIYYITIVLECNLTLRAKIFYFDIITWKKLFEEISCFRKITVVREKK